MSNESISPELFKEYCANSDESLANLERDLLEFEQNSEDKNLLSNIFREMHTMKGNAGFMQFSRTEKIAHHAEDILSKIRDGDMSVDTIKINAILASLDILKSLQVLIAANGVEPEEESEEYDSVIKKLNDIKNNQLGESVPVQGSSFSAVASTDVPDRSVGQYDEILNTLNSGEVLYEIIVDFNKNEPMLTPRAMIVVLSLKALGTVHRVLPDIMADTPEEVTEELEILFSSPSPQKDIQQACDVPGTVQTEVQIIQKRETYNLHEDEKTVTASETKPAPVPQTANQTTQLKESPQASTATAESTIRIDTEVLDHLMNQVGELVLSRNQIMQLVREDNGDRYAATAHRLNLITSEIQDGIMKTRLQPIRTVWSRFPRLIRDIALANGKDIMIHMEGADTELDKTLIEAIKDPLTHIVRNSVDHGVETKEARINKGKPAAGNVYLRAFHEGGQVIIEIKDDGAGINVKKIIQKSIEKNLISPDEAERMSDKEAFGLIFAAGLTTAEKVTNISGRGVGMDVVKTNIEKISGAIDISSVMDQGTAIRIKIPLTLAIIPALLVKIDDEKYAIPQAGLVELVRVDIENGEKIEKIGGAKFFRLRGNLLPLISLKEILYPKKKREVESEVEEQNSFLIDRSVNIVVLNSAVGTFGLIVDSISDTEEIVVKPLSSNLKSIAVFAGAAILGDGAVALILDANGLSETGKLTIDTMQPLMDEDTLDSRDNDNIVSFLLFTIEGNDRYAVPLSIVNRLEVFNRSQVERSSGKEVIQYRGSIISLIDLTKLFSQGVSDHSSEFIHCIVISEANQPVGLIVKEMIDVLELEAGLHPSPENPLLMGTAVIAGKTTDIIDVYKVLSNEMPSRFTESSGFHSLSANQVNVVCLDASKFEADLIKQYLASKGFHVIHSPNRQKVMEALKQAPVKVMLFDIDHHKINGLEFVKEIRAGEQYKQIHIIALTSSYSQEQAMRCKEAGFDDCVFKLDRESIYHSLEQVLLLN